MSLSSYNGQSNFTIKGKKFIKRGADNIYDIASVAGTGGNFSTGWVKTDDASNSVTNGATLTFNHNLGSADLLIEGYVSSTGSDSDAIQLTPMNRYGNTGMVGYKITGMTSNTVTIQLAGNGFGNPTSSGGLGNQGTNFSNEYIKFVVSAGGGGMARASGTIVAANATLTSWNLTSDALNVASMTQTYSSGSGRYGVNNAQFTITFSSPISKPIAIVTPENMGSYTVSGYTSTSVSHRQRVTFSNSSATTQSPLSTAFENQEFDTMLIYQGYRMPAWVSFVIF